MNPNCYHWETFFVMHFAVKSMLKRCSAGGFPDSIRFGFTHAALLTENAHYAQPVRQATIHRHLFLKHSPSMEGAQEPAIREKGQADSFSLNDFSLPVDYSEPHSQPPMHRSAPHRLSTSDNNTQQSNFGRRHENSFDHC